MTAENPAAPEDRAEYNGARSVVETLAASGIEVVFANPGTSEMHFVAALDEVPAMRPVLALFEGVATGAADGYARMAGRPAATLLHLGPGLGNGLANLHNARKAASPVVNVIGEHATGHGRFETPLASDVAAFASPVSHWVHTTRDASTAAADAARAVQAARTAPGQIASLVLPADTAWNPAAGPAPALPAAGPSHAPEHAIAAAAAALRAGDAALLIRGAALHDEGLDWAGRIAAATGARLFSATFAPRLRRGRGIVPVTRMPYRAADAQAALAGVRTLILVGTQAPIAFFAYPGQPSELTPAGTRVAALTHPHEDGTAALEAVARGLGLGPSSPTTASPRPALAAAGPLGDALDVARIYRGLARLLPEDAIVSDEAVTASFAGYPLLADAAPHDVLQLTGGAIGDGLPVATGAAIAAPGRPVIALEGDGSAMYTVQALWTQARENLDVTTIVFANRSYAVLADELARVGATAPGPAATSMLDLHDPVIDWVALAGSMGVRAASVADGPAFDAALERALREPGPHLIEARIP